MKTIKLIMFMLLILGIAVSCKKDVNNVTSRATVKDTGGQLKSTAALSSIVPSTFTLFAGQTIDVGTVSFADIGGTCNLQVTYTLTPPWVLTSISFWIGTTQSGYPASNGGPVPGQLPYIFDLDHLSTWTFCVPVTDLTCNTFYVLCHADVTDGTSSETAWSEGWPDPGSNWATGSTFSVYPVLVTKSIFYCPDLGETADLADGIVTDATTPGLTYSYYHEDYTPFSASEDPHAVLAGTYYIKGMLTAGCETEYSMVQVGIKCLTPVCDTWRNETAFGGNTKGLGKAWWYYYINDGMVQAITAGQIYNAGTVQYAAGTITIILADGWELNPLNANGTPNLEPVKIQGYTTIPISRPAAGLFTTYKGDLLVVPNVGNYPYYDIQLEVRKCTHYTTPSTP